MIFHSVGASAAGDSVPGSANWTTSPHVITSKEYPSSVASGYSL